MALHYMTVLGTGKYEPCNYVVLDEKTGLIKECCETPYIQKAVFSMLCKDFTENDRITVFVTSGARKKHGDELEAEFSAFSEKNRVCPKPNFVDIEEGLNSEDQWKNFNTMFEQIEQGEQVTVDITHGFRTIPMQMFAILNYAKTLKNITVNGIYYGVFEQPFGIKEDKYISYTELEENYVISERPKRYSEDVTLYYPVVDYTGYATITTLGNAAFMFSQTGDAGAIYDITKENKSRLYRSGADSNTEVKKRDFGVLHSLGEDLKNITESIKCTRGKNNIGKNPKENPEKSIYQAVCKYMTNEKKLQANEVSGENEAKAIKNIIDFIDRTIDDCFGAVKDVSEDMINIVTGLCTIKWCQKYGLVQAGFTALEETVISYVYGILDNDFIEELIRKKESDEDNSEKEEEFSEINKNKKSDSERRNREFIGHLITEYDKLSQKNAKPPTENYLKLRERLAEYEPDRLFKPVSQIKQARNDMNHFGFSTDIRKSSDLRRDLDRFFGEFEELVEMRKQDVPDESSEQDFVQV